MASWQGIGGQCPPYSLLASDTHESMGGMGKLVCPCVTIRPHGQAAACPCHPSECHTLAARRFSKGWHGLGKPGRGVLTTNIAKLSLDHATHVLHYTLAARRFSSLDANTSKLSITASITRSICASVICGNSGRQRVRSPMDSATGRSPGLYPKCLR